MKLSNLVKNKKQISELDYKKITIEHEKYLNDLRSVMGSCEIEYVDYIQQINQELDNLKKTIEHTKSITDNLLTDIKNQIDEKTKNWHQAGYTVRGEYQFTTATTIDLERSNRSAVPADTTKQRVLGVIQQYSNSQYACLEIGPGDGEWTPHLVASDPLYLVDIHQDFLDSTLFKFPEQYRRRIRPYLIEFNNQYNLNMLPQNQFGFIFSWNVFDYFPSTELKLYLESCLNVLRPGGRMVFSYNNCDTLTGVNFAEIGNKSWMTEEIVLTICKNLGFEVEISNTENESWVCIKKPGEMTTAKTHQALGEIKKDYR